MSSARGVAARRLRLLTTVLCITAALPGAGRADTLALADGSTLVGELVRFDDTVLVFRTGFAGKLKIDRAAVTGLSSDREVVISLPDGSRLVGRLDYDPEQGQSIDTDLVGRIPLRETQVAALWRPGEKSPETLALEKVEQRHAEEVATLKAAQREPHEVWSGGFEFGLSGQKGNTQKQDLNGRIVARRETDFDRLKLSLEGRSASDQDEQTEAEVIAKAGLERDFTERWFAFGETSFERDKFEDVDLRAMLSSGVGYFLIRKPNQEWKPRAGIGYRFESVENGANEGEFVLSLGYDYWVRVFGGLRFGHEISYLPSIQDPGQDYRIESRVGLRYPISGNEDWTIGFSLRHDYDALPPVGIDNLDTYYNLNLGYSMD